MSRAKASGGVKAACQPSPSSATRRRARGVWPPTQIGMRLARGLGHHADLVEGEELAAGSAARSCDQHARMIRMASSDQAPRRS